MSFVEYKFQLFYRQCWHILVDIPKPKFRLCANRFVSGFMFVRELCWDNTFIYRKRLARRQHSSFYYYNSCVSFARVNSFSTVNNHLSYVSILVYFFGVSMDDGRSILHIRKNLFFFKNKHCLLNCVQT